MNRIKTAFRSTVNRLALWNANRKEAREQRKEEQFQVQLARYDARIKKEHEREIQREIRRLEIEEEGRKRTTQNTK